MAKQVKKNFNVGQTAQALTLINWRDFEPLQNDNLKELSVEDCQKLKTSIIKHGFGEPFFVWYDKQGKGYILGGKHRKLVLLDMIDNGYTDEEGKSHVVTIPDQLPAVVYNFKNKKEAAQAVLTFSAKYAKETTDGLYEFMHLHNINIGELKDELTLPTIDLTKFEAGYFGDNNPGGGEGNNKAPANNDTNQPGEGEKPQSIEVIKGALFNKYLVPPFSVLDTRQGYWVQRKRLWLQLGVANTDTRDITTISNTAEASYQKAKGQLIDEGNAEPTKEQIIKRISDNGNTKMSLVSYTDPALVEVLLNWFVPGKGHVADPFAGGTSVGAVSAFLKHEFTGVELRPEQIESNNQKIKELFGGDHKVRYIEGDSESVFEKAFDGYSRPDFIFSSPPYHDLEVYSDNVNDLSNMDWATFKRKYERVIFNCCKVLNNNRFAAFLVTQVRDKDGKYKNLVGATISAFEKAGLYFYNDIVLINQAGSLPARVGRSFSVNRKVGRCHQNLLIFYKGNPETIRDNFNEVDIADLKKMCETGGVILEEGDNE